MDLSIYDRQGKLSDAEQEAVGLALQGIRSHTRGYIREALPELRRLLAPLFDVFEVMGAADHVARRTRNALLREMLVRRTAYWAWDREDWMQIMRGTSEAMHPHRYELDVIRHQLMGIAYLLCGFDSLHDVGKVFNARPFAEKVFGGDRLESAYLRVREELIDWGWGPAVLNHDLPTLLARVMLASRSPRLEDLTTQKLETIRDRHVPQYLKRTLVAVSRALAAQEVVAAPISLPRNAYPHGKEIIDECPEEWASWCRRWHATSTLAEASRRNALGSLLRAGRWLADSHPEVVSPEQWTRSLAAEYVKAVDGFTVGIYADSGRMNPAKVGKPMKARTKARSLGALRTFFRDCQEWSWIPRRFDPGLALAVPPGIRARIVRDPRVIDDGVWAKLLSAGLNLSSEDLPAAQYAPWLTNGEVVKGKPWYPLEMVRAVTVAWFFSGLRNNEIRRLRVGCIRWQRGDAAVHGTGETLPQDAVCWLDLPLDKGGRQRPKPVDPIVGKAVEAWEAVRPRQPPALDAKTAEVVNLLFSFRGDQLGEHYINRTLIPLLCLKAGVPGEDARGRITSHRARATIMTQLFNAEEGMDLFELQDWAGHSSPATTQHYVKVAPTRLAKSYTDAGYFGRNLRMIEVLVDQEAVRNGAAAEGEPWKFYDLGHGYCTYDFFQQCPHRMACARCSFYAPKDSGRAQLLEGRANLLRMREEMPLTDEEAAAVEDGVQLHQKLLDRLADVPTPAGPTPRDLLDGDARPSPPANADPSTRASLVPLSKKDRR